MGINLPVFTPTSKEVPPTQSHFNYPSASPDQEHIREDQEPFFIPLKSLTTEFLGRLTQFKSLLVLPERYFTTKHEQLENMSVIDYSALTLSPHPLDNVTAL